MTRADTACPHTLQNQIQPEYQLLEDIYAAHHGKVSDKWSIYLATYQRILSEHNQKPWRILEIGVQNGGSLEIWSHYFSQATHIIGCDINPDCGKLQFEDSRISVVVGDANTDATEEKISALTPAFDLVIDDGSHMSHDIVRSFARYFPKLANGGIFVAEDLHCSYWTDFEGGILHPASSMAFFKRLADVLNHEHWGVAQARRDLLASFSREYEVAFDEAALAHIHSVEFVNSICIVRKRTPADNILGPRFVKGGPALVEASVSHLDGSSNITPGQTENLWSKISLLPEDELQALRRGMLSQAERLQAQQAEFQAESESLKRHAETQRAELELLQKKLSNRDSQLRVTRARFEHSHAQAFKYKEEIKQIRASAHAMHEQLQQLNEQIQAIHGSANWKLGAPLRSLGRMNQRISRVTRRLSTVKSREGGLGRMLRKCIKILGRSGPNGVRRYLKQAETATRAHSDAIPGGVVQIGAEAEESARRIFDEQQQEFSESELRARIEGLRSKPLISIVMPVYKTPVQWLARVIESLQEQFYLNWELCAVDDCSPGEEQRRILEEFGRNDPRVRYHFAARNGGISTASNIALEMARGEYIALVDHDDEITPDALYWVAQAIDDTPEADFIYSDECKIDDTPERRLFHFIFKPKWSPEIMFNGMLTGHLTVYRKALVQQLGGFRKQYDFSQDYDLALRVAEQTRHIVHIERVLYLWRSIPGSAAGGGKDFARESNVAALADSLVRKGIEGKALALPHANRVRVEIPPDVKVSIIIPSDSYDNLRLAIDALLETTNFPNYEIVAVCNSPLAERLVPAYAHAPHVIFSGYDKTYNFSDKCNQGARDASGDVVIFYNDDVFPIAPDWITQLIEYLYIPGVGGISPKLLHQDDTIQYAGMISGTPGLCGTAYNHVPRDGNDPFLSMHKYVRDVSILSGACCALKKDLFERIGGFDAVNTPDGHSDMDLSYKVLAAGLRCVYTPYAVLHHIGHGSWNVKKHKYKADIFTLKRWGRYVSEDPFFTDSMKAVLYTDFRFHYKIYASHLDPAKTYSGLDVLFVSHELSLTGAPRMLFYAAQAVLAQGGFPVVVSSKDGPMREELVRAGIAVIIDESVLHDHFLFGGFAKNFDRVFVNTVALDGVVRQLQKFENLDLTWWLHEGKALESFFEKHQDIDAGRVRVLCVSEYAQGFIPARYRAEVLQNAVPDRRGSVGAALPDGTFTFLLPGTLERRKGQDIFAEAILLLPEEVRRACRFVLSGKLWEANQPFWNAILQRMAGVPQFEYAGLLEHQALLARMAGADVVVCCSRDESFSLSAAEGAMLGKPVILNRCVGIAQPLQQEGACLMFEPGDAGSLAAQMLRAFEHPQQTKALGARARQAYERRFTTESFAQQLQRHIGG